MSDTATPEPEDLEAKAAAARAESEQDIKEPEPVDHTLHDQVLDDDVLRSQEPQRVDHAGRPGEATDAVDPDTQGTDPEDADE